MAWRLLFLALLSCAVSDPIVIRSSLAKNQAEQGKAKNSDLYQTELSKANQNYANQEAYNKGSEKKFVNAQDSAKYGEEKEDKKFRERQGNFGDEQFHKNQGANQANFGKKIGHKKKEHKTGFHNTYHKDESGSNSSYYDDSNDEADEYVQDSKKGAFGDTSSGRNRGAYQDRKGHSNQHTKHGGYNNGGHLDKEAGNRNNYRDSKYYDNRNHEGRLKSGDQFGQHGQFAAQEKYTTPIYHPYHQGAHGHRGYYPQEDIQEEGYLQDYNAPSKRVITIFEDPRVLDGGYDSYSHNPGYDSDRVRLDIRRPPPAPYRQTRFYNRRPFYDDYY